MTTANSIFFKSVAAAFRSSLLAALSEQGLYLCPVIRRAVCLDVMSDSERA